MMNCAELNHQASLLDISDKKIVSVGKKHTKYYLFPINSCESPHVEICFDVNFRVKLLLVRFRKATPTVRLIRTGRGESCRK